MPSSSPPPRWTINGSLTLRPDVRVPRRTETPGRGAGTWGPTQSLRLPSHGPAMEGTTMTRCEFREKWPGRPPGPPCEEEAICGVIVTDQRQDDVSLLCGAPLRHALPGI